jgi:hypothetical protein
MIARDSVGPDIAASGAELRRRARRHGYVVDYGYVVEDWGSDTERKGRCGERGRVVEIDAFLVLRYDDELGEHRGNRISGSSVGRPGHLRHKGS